MKNQSKFSRSILLYTVSVFNRRRLALLLAITAVVVILGSLAPLLMGFSLQDAKIGIINSWLPLYLAAVSAPVFFGHLLSLGYIELFTSSISHLRFRLMQFGTQAYRDKENTISRGDKFAIIEHDVIAFERMSTILLSYMPQSILRLMGIAVAVIYANTHAAIMFFGTVLSVYGIGLVMRAKTSDLFDTAQAERQAVLANLSKLLEHKHLFSKICGGSLAWERLILAHQSMLRTSRLSQIAAHILAATPQMMSSALIVCLLAFSSANVIIPVGIALALVIYAEQIMAPISMVTAHVEQIRLGIPSVRKIQSFDTKRHEEIISNPQYSCPSHYLNGHLQIKFANQTLEQENCYGILALMAPNGFGKTTALLSLCGLIDEDLGSNINHKESRLYLDADCNKIAEYVFRGHEDSSLELIRRLSEKCSWKLVCIDELLDDFHSYSSIIELLGILKNKSELIIVVTHENKIFDLLKNQGAVGVKLGNY